MRTKTGKGNKGEMILMKQEKSVADGGGGCDGRERAREKERNKREGQIEVAGYLQSSRNMRVFSGPSIHSLKLTLLHPPPDPSIHPSIHSSIRPPVHPSVN